MASVESVFFCLSQITSAYRAVTTLGTYISRALYRASHNKNMLLWYDFQRRVSPREHAEASFHNTFVSLLVAFWKRAASY